MADRIKVYFDGGCRPNPGAIEVAVVAKGQTTIRRDLGEGGNGDAEWLALIEGLTVAQSLGLSDFVLLGDASNVIAKANGKMRCRDADLPYFGRLLTLAGGSAPRVRYIKRFQNLAGIALAQTHDR
jgi:ribonuclease HI